ncbi:MAG: cyclodeaminase [Desulfobacterales bacterium]|nr:MAG: cyclodeaminase [Desulfobacterales bacterium]
MKVIVLTESELRQVVKVDHQSIAAIEDAFTWLAENKVAMPPIMHIEVPEYQGDVDIKSAYVSGLDRFAVKIGAGFFQNYQLGLPNSPAMMVVISAKTGVAEAILLDNAYLTDVRTGAAGAVVAKHLAPSEVTTAGVIGAGAQGRYQMMGLKTVRDFKRLLVYDLDESRVKRYIAEMESTLDAEILPAIGAEDVIRRSQAVVTCTPSRRPHIEAEWLHPGLHITAMGADLTGKQELEAEAVAKADILVCDRKTQSFQMGEFQHAFKAGIISDASPVIELGEITSGRRSGRQNDHQITICDLSGTGVQDTAIAHLAVEQAVQRGFGTKIEMDIGR